MKSRMMPKTDIDDPSSFSFSPKKRKAERKQKKAVKDKVIGLI